MTVPGTPALIIGHRGASGYRPEHTRDAYDLAIRLGADAIEPDIVASRDGVLVLRHENEISGTTDVAARSEFADRRTTKEIDGAQLTGWFTEDFSWAELSTLRARERLPELRPHAATFDEVSPILRLADLLGMLDAASDAGHPVGLVAEVKHPTYFDAVGIPLEELVAAELAAVGRPDLLTVECFEQGLLTGLRGRGLAARYVYLLDETGAAPDLVARSGADAVPYAAQLTDAGLAALAGDVDGISVAKSLVLADDGADLVDRAHAAGLSVFTWTARPENAFLAPAHRRFAAGSASDADWGDWRAEFTALLATGVDGVFADHPDLARAARDGS